MGELADEQRDLEAMPAWVPDYLAAWGSKLDPDGKLMRVKTAAALAGTTASNVRNLRERNERFRLLEMIARNAGGMWLSSYMEAGIRVMAPEVFRSFRRLIEAGNPQVVLQAMKWALNQPDSLDVQVRGVVASDDVSELSNGELDARLNQLFDKARKGAASGAPGGEGAANGSQEH